MAGHHDPLLEVLVLEVGAGERGQLQVELLGDEAGVAAGPSPSGSGHLGDVAEAHLEAVVVGGDELGEPGLVDLDDRLEEAVLVLGVALEQRRPATTTRSASAESGGPVGRVESSRPRRRRTKSSERMPLWMSR